MVYRVIVTSNGKYVKTLYQCVTRTGAFKNYHELRDENKKILFPKRFINSRGIKPVKYQIVVTKPTEPTDTFRQLRDDYGKTYIEKPIGDWTILDSAPYEVEETFLIYGMESNVRPTIGEVVKKLSVGAHKQNVTKQVIVVHNKLIIYNEDQFDMVLCKCKEDAQRLHHALAKVAKKQKIKSFIFMGTATQATVSQMYKIIQEKTGWLITKIRRRATYH